MWFSRILRLLLTGTPEPLSLTSEPGEAAFRGRYLHIEGLPFALGRMIGQGDEAMVYELVSLRRGNCGYVVKICRYSPGSARYERWAVPVRDESNPYAEVPDVERYPARLLKVPGGLVKVQQYVTGDPATAWATPYPAADVYRYLEQYGPEQALNLTDILLGMHGPRGVLLEAKAVSLMYADRRTEAEPAFEAAIETLTTERNVSRFSATCRLATMLWEDYHDRPPPGDGGLILRLPDGSVHQQTYFAMPEDGAVDDTEQDRPVMLLLEVLAEEPYLVCALELLVFMIADALLPAGPAVRAAVAAIEQVDPGYDGLPRLRQIAERFGSTVSEINDPDQRSEQEPATGRPSEADEYMDRYNKAYRPDPTRGQQARGRYLAAQAHLEGRRFDEAERELRAAVALDPGTLQYQVTLVELLSHTAQLDEARELAEAAAWNFPDDPASYECLGHTCVIRGEYEDGLLAFLRALQAEPPEPWLLEVKIGQTYRDLGKAERALAFLRVAYGHAPDEPMTAVALAQILRADAENSMDDPRFQEAFDLLTAAVERNPYSADVLVCLAQSHLMLGHAQETRALLRRAVDAGPDHPFARDFLAKVEQWLAETSNE